MRHAFFTRAGGVSEGVYATLNGGTLEVTGADSGYVSNTHTDVLTATGGVSALITAK